MHCAEKGMVDVITALLDHVQKIPEEETSPSRRRRRRRKKKKEAPPPTFLAVDATTPGGGETALHLAAVMGELECVRLLVGAGADVAKRNKEGETALEAAHWDVVDFLAPMDEDFTFLS